MDLVFIHKNIPGMGQSKCKMKDWYNIEFDEGKNKIIITFKNGNQTVIYIEHNEEITTTMTFKKIG